jgi:hypothetical protein
MWGKIRGRCIHILTPYKETSGLEVQGHLPLNCIQNALIEWNIITFQKWTKYAVDHTISNFLLFKIILALAFQSKSIE